MLPCINASCSVIDRRFSQTIKYITDNKIIFYCNVPREIVPLGIFQIFMRYKARLLTTSICERDFERDTQRVFLYLQLSWFIYFSSITDLYMGYLWYDNISNDKRRCDRDFSYKIFSFDLMKSIYDFKIFS